MLRPILLAVMSFALIVCAPVAAQDRNPPANGGAGARGKAAARQGAAKPAADEEPATQPAEDAEEPAPPARSDLRRSRLSSDVDRSIRKAVKFLVSRQNADGSWSAQGERDDLDVGTTALVTLALLSAGESHQSPALVKAVRYLKAAPAHKAPIRRIVFVLIIVSVICLIYIVNCSATPVARRAHVNCASRWNPWRKRADHHSPIACCQTKGPIFFAAARFARKNLRLAFDAFTTWGKLPVRHQGV